MADSTGTVVNSPASSFAAAPSQIPVSHSFRSVEKWDSQRTSGIPQETSEAIINVHRLFARSLARSLGVYLRAVVEVEPSAGRQTSYEEMESALTPGTLTIAVRLESHVSPVFVLVDAAIASPCLDLLLGGSGDKPLERVELSDVDVQILSELSRMIARELQITWQDLNLKLQPELSIGKAARRTIPPVGKALRIDFAMKLGESSGNISLVLATPLVESIFQTLNVPVKIQDVGPGRTIGKEFSDALTSLSVPMELVLPAMRVSIGDLMRLTLNQVLTLPLRAGQPAQLVVAGRELFSAFPARSGRWRAAKIEHTILKTNSDQERPDPQ